MKKALVIMVIAALCFLATGVPKSLAAPNNGYISLAFDDSNRSEYDYAFPLLLSRGMVGTFYVVTDKIRDFSNDNSYMSMAELLNLQGNGSEIASHSKTHKDFLSLTDAQIHAECNVSKQVLQSAGLTVNNFAYPYGDTNDHIDSIVSQYFRSGRTAYNVPYIMQTIQFRLNAVGGETGDSTVLSYLQDIVNYVSYTKSWTIIFFHNIIPDVNNASFTISTQDFSSFLDYVNSKGVQTLTVNQALDLPTSTLTMATNYGTVSPVSGQYITGTMVTISANQPVAGPGERFTWLGWTGSGTGSYTGLDNTTSIWMAGPINQTASWKHEYYLNVTSPHGEPGGQGWYDAGSTAYATLATGNVSGGVGIRYVFDAWSGNASGTGLTSNAITMNGPKTAKANWKTQYYITVNSAHDSPTSSAWVDAGSDFNASVTSPTETVPKDHQWVCTGFSVDGGSYQNGTSYTFTDVYAPHRIEFAWEQQSLKQFLIQVNSLHGSPTPSQSIDPGGNLTVSVTSPADDNGIGTRYRCIGYKIDNGSLQAGTSYTFTNVQADHVIEFQWITQYQVTLGETGLDSAATGTVVTVDGSAKSYSDLPFSKWVDSGSSVTYTYADLVTSSVSGSRFKLSSVTGPASSITISGATSVTGSYAAQYYLSVVSPQGTSDGAGWYDSGATAYATLTQPTVNASSGVRYVFTGWSGDASGAALTSNPIIVNRSMSASASWKKQFLVVFDQNGLPDGLEAKITVNSLNQTLPSSIWIDEGATVEFTYQGKLPYGFGRQYVLTSTSNNSPLNVESPITVTAQYTSQTTIEMYVAIIIPVVLAVLAIGVVILRRRKRPDKILSPS